MAYTLLQDHNVDAVHRLIELLLRFDMRQECRRCLGFLFEYQCKWEPTLNHLFKAKLSHSSHNVSCRLAPRSARLLRDHAQQPRQQSAVGRRLQSEAAQFVVGRPQRFHVTASDGGA